MIWRLEELIILFYGVFPCTIIIGVISREIDLDPMLLILQPMMWMGKFNRHMVMSAT